VRYAYAMTAALLLGGTTATLALQSPAASQTAQNEPGTAAATTAPRPGAPMSFADLAARLQPAVVNISTRQKVQVAGNNPFAGTPFADLFGGGQGRPVTREAQSLGSGFVISADGYIVTNNHVVSPGERGAAVSSITVTFPDRTEYAAKLIGRDPASDLAVLKIEGKNLPFVRFGDSAQTRVGDWVVAIGNPYGLGGTVTAGIVSALHRKIGSGPSDRYIQTDASINQGNSGGPMFDMNGNVVGINTAIFSPTGGNVGIGFAIPSEVAAPIIETLKSGGKVKRGYLGVGIQPLDEGAADALGLAKNQGELIARVEPNEAAAKAGIREGDVVVRVAGRDVTPDQTLSFIIASQSVGARVPIEVIRNGKRMTFTAVLGERPPEDRLAAIGNGEPGLDPEDEKSTENATRGSIGLAVQALTPEIGRQLGLAIVPRGVVVSAVDPDSDSAAKGLRRGDIILTANQQPTTNPAELSQILAAAKKAGRSNVLLYVQRANMPPRYVAVKFR
jgi:serine protease Do